MLRLLKSGEARSLAVAAQAVGLCHGQVRKLFNCYRREGLAGLLRWRYNGNRRKLKHEDELKLVAESGKRENGFASQRQAQTYIATTFGVLLTQPAISIIFARNGIRNKTGRPRNILTSEGEQQKYKKNSRPK